MRTLSLLALLAAGPLAAQIAIQGTTATQAVISYTAPDSRACRIDVSDTPRYSPPVNDVNPALFPQSNQDLERPSTVTAGNGRSRIAVIGSRIAETAPANGRRFSRALQAYTRHYVRVTCGQAVWESTFDTTNIPLGLTYNDGLPADPNKPGETAWPSVDWTDRFQRIVDPRTGLLIQRLTMADDSPYLTGFTPYAGAADLEGAWISPTAVIANDNQSASAAARGWLFLEAGLRLFREGTRAYPGYSLNAYQLELNAWCDNCGTAPAPARTLEACLTVDGFSCAGRTLETTVEACSAGCNTDRYKLILGPESGAPVHLGWGMDHFDMLDYHKRSGQVSRRGAELRHNSGHLFNLNWKPGTRISVNGRHFTIDKLVNDRLLTLAGDPAGNEEGEYTASTFGVLLRRKAEGAGRIQAQFARQSHAMGYVPEWDAGGDQELNTSCAPNTTAGPGGEQGWHCNIGEFLYWIGSESGVVNRLGNTLLPTRAGADGWVGLGICAPGTGGGPVWDPGDPDVFYCGMPSPDRQGNVLVRGKYFGSNADAGSRLYGSRLIECNASRSNTPCFQFTNLTPGSGPNLNEQFQRFHPEEWAAIRGAVVTPLQRQDGKIVLYARAGGSNNDSLGFMGVWDIAAGRVTAATPSWKYFPLRWTGLHGVGGMYDSDWMPVAATHFRGATAGRDVLPGFGPYFSRVTSGAIPAAGTPCPARPANSPIPPAQWPTGNRCLELTVDGEPADPTPFYVSDGTVSSSGAAITGTNTSWQRWYDGAQLRIDGRWYRFSYVSATSGRIAPEPPAPLRNAAYELYLDAVNSSKTGNPMHGYLQDAEVRDLFVLSNSPEFPDFFGYAEYVRLIGRNGNRWTVERAVRNLGGTSPSFAFNANAYLIARPGSCTLGPTYPCANPVVAWNVTADPEGKNRGGTTLVTDPGDEGLGHSTFGVTAAIAAVAERCEVIDGRGYSCYNVRPGNGFVERVQTGLNYTISNNPPFDGRVGIGSPNEIDSHPSMRQKPESADPRDLAWFLDARPFIGATNFTGSAGRPGEPIEENVYKFVPEQLPRLRPKELPTLAFCGSSPLRDISGPGSRISAANAYTYCYARDGGECREDSSPGELFVSCPHISMPYCQYPGVGVPGADQRDICVMDQGSHNQAIVQLRHTQPETDGAGSRVLTFGLGRYRHNDIFWNAKTTPDGKWLLFRTLWVDGKRADAFLAKLPPFEPLDDQKRNTYQAVELKVEAGPFASALVEFGYNPAFECTSRKEACLAGAGNGFSYAVTEAAAPVPCAGGCTLQFPVVPQRAAYFRIRQYDADGKQIGQSGTNVWAFP